MFCQNCGKEVPENIKFCNYCGAEQGVDSSPASFQEASQQQSYDCYEPQQQTVIAAKIRNALKLKLPFAEVLKRCNMSEATFYRRLREYRLSN